MNNRSKSNDEYIESVLRMKDDFTRAFQVTCKGYEKNKVEVVDIKLDVSDLIGIIIKNCFEDRERKAINNYIDIRLLILI